MRNRRSELDMSHTLTTYARLGYLNSAFVTDLALVADLFVLSAVTLPVLAGSKDPLTEKTLCLRLQSTIVDCFRLGYLSS